MALHKSQMKAYQEFAAQCVEEFADDWELPPIVASHNNVAEYTQDCIAQAKTQRPNWKLTPKLEERSLVSIIQERAQKYWEDYKSDDEEEEGEEGEEDEEMDEEGQADEKEDEDPAEEPSTPEAKAEAAKKKLLAAKKRKLMAGKARKKGSTQTKPKINKKARRGGRGGAKAVGSS